MTRILNFIASNKWITAKAVKNPHQYVVRNKRNNDDFVYFAEYIRKHGTLMYFWNVQYVILNINGHRYWTMGSPINKDGKPYTIILNRTETSYETSYDTIAEKYTEFYSTENFKEQDKRLIDLLDLKGSILDVGCGAGLLFDYVPHNNYIGIDPSIGLLTEARKKDSKYITVNTSVEHFMTDKKFDTIVALYGSGSYLTQKELNKCEMMLNKGGTIYSMVYKKSHNPYIHAANNISDETSYNLKHDGYTPHDFDEYTIYKFTNV